MASHWDVPFWWSCCTINMMKLGHKHPWKMDAIHCDSQLFQRRSNFQSFAGIALWQWGDALNAPLHVQGERIGSRKNMVKSGDISSRIRSPCTSVAFGFDQFAIPRSHRIASHENRKFRSCKCGREGPWTLIGAKIHLWSSWSTMSLGGNWKPGNEPNLFYLKSWKFQITYQKFTFAKERQNLVLQIFDENVLRQEPKGTRFHISRDL